MSFYFTKNKIEKSLELDNETNQLIQLENSNRGNVTVSESNGYGSFISNIMTITLTTQPVRTNSVLIRLNKTASKNAYTKEQFALLLTNSFELLGYDYKKNLNCELSWHEGDHEFDNFDDNLDTLKKVLADDMQMRVEWDGPDLYN